VARLQRVGLALVLFALQFACASPMTANQFAAAFAQLGQLLWSLAFLQRVRQGVRLARLRPNRPMPESW
jgi:hypothetical protein